MAGGGVDKKERKLGEAGQHGTTGQSTETKNLVLGIL